MRTAGEIKGHEYQVKKIIFPLIKNLFFLLHKKQTKAVTATNIS
jgi:hypothetical protein